MQREMISQKERHFSLIATIFGVGVDTKKPDCLYLVFCRHKKTNQGWMLKNTRQNDTRILSSAKGFLSEVRAVRAA
jgi:hypothetical protein